MPFIKTSHYRIVNLTLSLATMLALINDVAIHPGAFPQYKHYLLYIVGALMVGCLCFVRPTPDVGPLKVPQLSLLQLRVVSGILLALSLLCLANYRLLDPGYFVPYKKKVMVGAFALMGLFIVLYLPVFERFMAESKGHSPSKQDET
jgi:hypothetical protein